MRGILAAAAAIVLLAGCRTVSPKPPAAVYPPSDYSAAQIDALRKNRFRAVDGNWELGIEDQLLFDTGMSTLAPGRQAVVDKLVKSLLAAGVRGGLLEGHTDSVGTASYNAGLSRARAEAVKAAMVTSGMEEARIRLVALGEGYPVQSNRTETGRKENRRVILIVTPADVQ